MIRRPPRSTRSDTLFPTRRSSDLRFGELLQLVADLVAAERGQAVQAQIEDRADLDFGELIGVAGNLGLDRFDEPDILRSEEHTSELQSLMRISYAVFCLKKENTRDTVRLQLCDAR